MRLAPKLKACRQFFNLCDKEWKNFFIISLTNQKKLGMHYFNKHVSLLDIFFLVIKIVTNFCTYVHKPVF